MKDKTVKDILAKFDHVGVLVKDISKAEEYYGKLGIGPFAPYKMVHKDRKVYGKPAPEVKNAAVGVQLGPIGFELIQPISGKSVQKEFMDNNGEGINHICFLVDDIDEAISIMIDAGFNVISSSKHQSGGGMAYFDTDRIGGVQIELKELPKDFERSWGYEYGKCYYESQR